jgi:hypothetical protein
MHPKALWQKYNTRIAGLSKSCIFVFGEVNELVERTSPLALPIEWGQVLFPFDLPLSHQMGKR